jgi:hypothetical protein
MGPAGSFGPVELPSVGLSLLRRSDGLDLVEGTESAALARVIPLERRAVLLGGMRARILVNGEALLGVRVLEEGDELFVAGEQIFFGAAGSSASRPVHAEDGAQRCGRCRRLLHPGDIVVECGNCEGLHHEGVPAGESEALLCWSHAAACGLCQHDRRGWTPGEPDGA